MLSLSKSVMEEIQQFISEHLEMCTEKTNKYSDATRPQFVSNIIEALNSGIPLNKKIISTLEELFSDKMLEIREMVETFLLKYFGSDKVEELKKARKLSSMEDLNEKVVWKTTHLNSIKII